MADGAAPSRMSYPLEEPHLLTYQDPEIGQRRVYNPITGYIYSSDSELTFLYPNWVVHQLERERDEVVAASQQERAGHHQTVGNLEAEVTALQGALAGANLEKEQLRQRVQHLEERLHQIRTACEPTVVISSGHAEPQDPAHSDPSVNHEGHGGAAGGHIQDIGSSESSSSGFPWGFP